MSERSGPIKLLQAAATHAIVDTYYDVTNTIKVGMRANSLRLYVTAEVASPGDISFRLTINNPGNADMGAAVHYDYATEGEGHEVFGPLKFTAVGTKVITLTGLDLIPLDVVQVSYAASAAAASATVKIVGEAFHSDLSGSQRFSTDSDGGLILASYQTTSEADRIEEINPLDTRDVVTICADGATVAQATTVDFFVPMSHMKGCSLQWEPSDGHYTLKVYATNEDNGTALASCEYHDVTNDWFGAASFTADMLETASRDVCVYGIHIEVVRAGGAGNGTHKLYVRRNY